MSRLIDADELVKKRSGCKRDCRDCDYAQERDSWCQGSVFVVNILELPTIEAEPVRHGHWNKMHNVWECSECGETISMRKYEEYRMNYCSNCGAKMDGESDEE